VGHGLSVEDLFRVRAAGDRLADQVAHRVEHDTNLDAGELKMGGHFQAVELGDVLIEDEHVWLELVDE